MTNASPCCRLTCGPSSANPRRHARSPEQKIADDYFPVLRIDPDKIMEIMPAADRKALPGPPATARPGSGRPARSGAAGVLDRGSRPEEGAWKRATS